MRFPLQKKFRLSRGPLRDWLLFSGLMLVDFQSVRFFTGAVLVLLGAAYHFVCKCYLRQNRELTVAGPYRFTRHPYYLANLVVECGLLVIIGNVWLSLVYLAIWFWIYGRVIDGEEATLARLFGDTYAIYCRRVPRLFPMPGRYMSPTDLSGPRFSLRNRNISEGREIERSLRLASFPLLLLAASNLHPRGMAVVVDSIPRLIYSVLGFAALNILGAIVTKKLTKAKSSRVQGRELRKAA